MQHIFSQFHEKSDFSLTLSADGGNGECVIVFNMYKNNEKALGGDANTACWL